MKWTQKSAAYKVIDWFPKPDDMYFYLQKYITRSVPRARERFQSDIDLIDAHIFYMDKHLPTFREEPLLIFGAGWDLCECFAFQRRGVKKQLVYDLNRLAKIELINHVIELLNEIDDVDIVRPRITSLDTDLSAHFGIDYRAPHDVRKSNLPDGSIGACSTTNTLEHIPFDSLREILAELHRVIRKDGIISMSIDYKDHFAMVDSSINIYNFLRFSETEWTSYNPSRHFQNRRRHIDYRHLFESAGFEIVEEVCRRPDNWRALLDSQPISTELSSYSLDEISIAEAEIVARRI